MTAHELAKILMDGPDCRVEAYDWSYQEAFEIQDIKLKLEHEVEFPKGAEKFTVPTICFLLGPKAVSDDK